VLFVESMRTKLKFLALNVAKNEIFAKFKNRSRDLDYVPFCPTFLLLILCFIINVPRRERASALSSVLDGLWCPVAPACVCCCLNFCRKHLRLISLDSYCTNDCSASLPRARGVDAALAQRALSFNNWLTSVSGVMGVYLYCRFPLRGFSDSH